MKRKQQFDTPVLNMIKSFNDFAGGSASLIELRDQWYFHMGSHQDNRFVYWLELAMEMVPGKVNVVYKRQPGWYSEVEFEIPEEIKVS